MTFDSRSNAEGWLSLQRAAIITGTWAGPAVTSDRPGASPETLGEYALRWVDQRTSSSGRPLRPRTADEYRRLLRTTLEPLADTPLVGLSRERVRRWHGDLLHGGIVTTAARAYGLLRSIYNTAVEDGLLERSPVTIRGASSGRTGRRVEPPTVDELRVMVASIGAKYRAMVLIAAWGGLRFGELTELRRRDVTVADGLVVIRVERAVTKTDSGYVVGPPKSEAGRRSVTLPPNVTEAVHHHLATFVLESPNALLFPAGHGGHLAESTLAKSWYPARRAANREDMPFHALRHFAGTYATAAGASLREVQRRLGHSTVTAAMRYQHAVADDSSIARRIGALA